MMNICARLLRTPSSSSLSSLGVYRVALRRIAVLCAPPLAATCLGCAHAGPGVSDMGKPVGTPYCVGVHQVLLPPGAEPRLSSTYAGLRDQDQGLAQWDAVLAWLHRRAEASASGKTPHNGRAAELYRAAGANPETAFASSNLVGFDVNSAVAVIAEHSGPSAAFNIEVHYVEEGRHFVFEGEGSQASRYPAIRDGVLDAVARFRPNTQGVPVPPDAFCTSNGHFRLEDGRDVAGDVQLVVTFQGKPGLTFALNAYGLVEPSEEPLFALRAARDLVELARNTGRVKSLHEGGRRYGGQTGQLIATSVLPEGREDGKTYRYSWHAAGRPRDPYAPEIEVELLAEGMHGLDQVELDELWDDLMTSFQLRRDAR